MCSNPAPQLRTTIVVDMQNDFCENGVLATENVSSLFAPLNKFLEETYKRGHYLVYTQDWHPKNHSSFKENGGEWAKHCVGGTYGAELSPNLYLAPEHIRLLKGTSPYDEGYSAFSNTGLHKLLNKLSVKEINVVGVATSYCVMHTALEAKKLGFEVCTILPLCRNVPNANSLQAKIEMKKAGITIIEK